MNWFDQLKKAKKTCLEHGNIRKVHYDFGNGKELVEEWNTELKIAVRRAWKDKSKLEADEWTVELGEPDIGYMKDKEGQLLFKESTSQPFVERRVTKRSLEWRIRNLTYPADNYIVTTDDAKKKILVKTKNKKYYKVLTAPELERLNLLFRDDLLSFVYNNYNTLVITYRKPQELLQFETALWEEIQKVPFQNRDGPDSCKTN